MRLATITKTSTKTKVLIAAAVIVVGAGVISYANTFIHLPNIDFSKIPVMIDEEALARQTALRKTLPIDRSKAGSQDLDVVKKEIERWINANLEWSWKYGSNGVTIPNIYGRDGVRYAQEKMIRDKVCKYILDKLASSKFIYGCGADEGSYVDADLGTSAPKISILKYSRKIDKAAGVFHDTMTFTAALNAKDAKVKALVKCKVAGIDKGCSDGVATMTGVQVAVAESTASFDIGLYAAPDIKTMKVGKVTSTMNLKGCLKIVFVGKECVDLSALVAESFNKEVGSFVTKTLNSL